VDRLVEANVLEKDTVSIFRAEVTEWQEGMSEGKGQSGRSEVEIEPSHRSRILPMLWWGSLRWIDSPENLLFTVSIVPEGLVQEF
jgi:hypothetical protein